MWITIYKVEYYGHNGYYDWDYSREYNFGAFVDRKVANSIRRHFQKALKKHPEEIEALTDSWLDPEWYHSVDVWEEDLYVS